MTHTLQPSNFCQSRKPKAKKWRCNCSSYPSCFLPHYICSLYQVQLLVLTSVSPVSGLLSLTQGLNFVWTPLLDAKLLAHSFLSITSYGFLLIIKGKFLGIIQSEQKTFPSICVTTLSMNQTLAIFLLSCYFSQGCFFSKFVRLGLLKMYRGYRLTGHTSKTKFPLQLDSTCNMKFSSPSLKKGYAYWRGSC